MKTITLDTVDTDILIKCLNYVKNDLIFANDYLGKPDETNLKIISRIENLLNKI